MVKDLLPLYKDGACSQASSRIVEEHLAECEDCKKIMNELADTSIDEMIDREKADVIGSQTRYFKRKSALAGGIIAGIFALPILISLIVNLVSGHALTWFFIVLAAMLVPTSMIVVPLMAPKNKLFLTLTSFPASVILLLAVICIYSGGNWFFVAAASMLFGFTVCFSPFIVCHEPVKGYLGNNKGLTAMTACTITFFLMILCIGLHVHNPGYFPMAFGISVPCVLIVWIMFLIIRYLPLGGLAKTGLCTAFIGIVSIAANKIIAFILLRIPDDNEVLVNTGPSDISAIVVIAIGMILVVIGLLTGRKGGKDQ